MNSVWNHTQKNWTISFHGEDQKWILDLSYGEGFILAEGGYIQNNLLIVPHPIKCLRNCAVRAFKVQRIHVTNEL
jgi:hypothetical protein